MGNHSGLADDVDCYCVDRITIDSRATVSQYSFLCTATHDHTDARFPLVTAPITIGPNAWICADVFVSPGTTVGEGAVVGARSSVFSDIPSWTIARGTPAKPVGKRLLRSEPSRTIDGPDWHHEIEHL